MVHHEKLGVQPTQLGFSNHGMAWDVKCCHRHQEVWAINCKVEGPKNVGIFEAHDILTLTWKAADWLYMKITGTFLSYCPCQALYCR